MWLKVIQGLAILLDMWIKWSNRKKSTEEIELTEGQQKAHGKVINAINKEERATNRKLNAIDSVRKRTEAINKIKNTDV